MTAYPSKSGLSWLWLRLGQYLALALSFFLVVPPLRSAAELPVPVGRSAILALLCFAVHAALARRIKPTWVDVCVQSSMFFLLIYAIYTRVNYC